MKLIKKQNVFGWVSVGGAVLALIAMIIFAVNSTTGYLAGQPINALPIVLPVIAILGAAALFVFEDRLDPRLQGVATFALALLSALSLVFTVVARIDVMGDLLNPIDHPEEQVYAVNVAIAAMVFYGLSFAAFVAATVAGKLHKDV